MADYWDIHTGEALDESQLEERFDNMLDEVYGDRDGDISICGLDYRAAYALEAIDPIAYRVAFNDWLDSELGETITEDEPEDEEDEE